MTSYNPQYPTVMIPTHIPPVYFGLAGTMTNTVECTFAAGTSMSTAIDMTQSAFLGFNPLAIFLPSAWTTAHLSFQASWDNITFSEFHTLGGHLATTGTRVANDVTSIDGYPLRGIPFFRIRSGLVASPVNQVALRTVKVLCGTY
jgi:hypothetical protein